MKTMMHVIIANLIDCHPKVVDISSVHYLLRRHVLESSKGLILFIKGFSWRVSGECANSR